MKIVNKNSNTQKIKNCKIGNKVKLCSFINLYDCEIADGCLIGTFVEIQKNVKVGKNTRIQSHSFICEGVTLGENVFIGHNVTFINDNHPSVKSAQTGNWKVLPVVVEDNVVIGSGAVILGGVTLHQGAVVGAGSVVTKDVKANAVVVGVPAKEKKNK